MPSFLSRTALAVASLAAVAKAFPSPLFEDPDAPEYGNGLPKVTPVYVGSDCEGYPVGNFSLIVSHCTNSTTNEPCDIEGFHNNAQIMPGSGDDDFDEGLVTFPLEKQEPVNLLQCWVGSRSVEVVQIQAPGHGTGLTPSRVAVSNVTDSMESLKWTDYIEPIPESYYHYTYEGDPYEGAFLGFNKETGWAIKYQEGVPNGQNSNPYWGVRLLQNGEPLREGESSTWLKISGMY